MIDVINDGDANLLILSRFHNEAHAVWEIFREIPTAEVWDESALNGLHW